jgi:hypothetical protein
MTTQGGLPSLDVSKVWSEEKRQQGIALGRLGWPLRRIERAIRVRRETAGACLNAGGVPVRPPGAWGRRAPAKPANEVTPGSGLSPAPGRSPGASTCEPYRDFIEISLSKGPNAKASFSRCDW